MWRAATPAAHVIAQLKQVRERHGLAPLVIHDNYLINLASFDPEIRAKSIAAFRGELQRALAIGAEYLVFHPGSAREHSPEDAIAAVASGLREAARGLSGPLMLLIENTAGQGKALGSQLDELAEIRARSVTEFEIGYCIDTCHALASGYDVASERGWAAFVEEVERRLGWERIPVIHANDSKGGLGSKLDRHANIGDGCIGEAGFRRILRDPHTRDKAFILETPFEDDGDRRDLAALRRLAAGD